MNIESFISETLTGIFNGVINAQASIIKTGGAINPGMASIDRNVSTVFYPNNGKQCIACIADFDIAVTVSNEKNGGGKIRILAADIGGKISGNDTQATRVKFSVPYMLPRQEFGFVDGGD